MLSASNICTVGRGVVTAQSALVLRLQGEVDDCIRLGSLVFGGI